MPLENRQILHRAPRVGLAFCFAIASMSGAHLLALITGGEGKDLINDPGWPKGAAAVFNTECRVAHWTGPGFGGGQDFADCRGDDVAIQRVLEDFANIETPLKRVVVRDGTGTSVWLNATRTKGEAKDAQIDWSFMVWNEKRRMAQRRLPVELRSIGKTDPAILAQLEIYTGGSIRWANVRVPDGIDILDQRLEAHGFSKDDGNVLEGNVVDVATRSPLLATLKLQKKNERQPNGEGLYTDLIQVATDAKGHWLLTQAPQEPCRLVLAADGFATRIIGYPKTDNQPRWFEYNSGLSKSGAVSGQVVDHQGRPLADVGVTAHGFDVKNTGRYDVLEGVTAKTNADGQFTLNSLPTGTATIRVHKPGYVRPGLGQNITIPAKDLKLEMDLSATLRVTVDFADAEPPEDYLVHIVPEGGEQVGKWSGSVRIKADRVIKLEDVPADRYVVTGMPIPGHSDQRTNPITIDLKMGDHAEITLQAK